MSALLLDASGTELARAETPNRQSAWGLDVLTRLSESLKGDAERVQLRDAAQESVLTAALEASLGANLDFEEVLANLQQIVVAANPVMAALFTGQDANGLATAPFMPVEDLRLTEGPLADALPDTAQVDILSPLAHFVGGDTRAALCATGLNFDYPAIRALVDLGTNAELALRVGENIYVTSAAAGPAFAGGGARWQPSQLLSAVAELRREGALDADGSLNHEHHLVEVGKNGVAFAQVAPGFAISQLLIRDLQTAKAAVQVGLEALMEAAGVDYLEELLIAGAFGEALPVEDMDALRFFGDITIKQTGSVGNAALEGAYHIAAHWTLPDIFGTLHAVELTALPDFQTRLLDSLSFS